MKISKAAVARVEFKGEDLVASAQHGFVCAEINMNIYEIQIKSAHITLYMLM